MKNLQDILNETYFDPSALINLDIEKLLDSGEKKLYKSKKLYFVIKLHTNRKIDDIQGYGGRFLDVKGLGTKYYNAVQTQYERGMHVNKRAANIKEIEPKEEYYTPYYDFNEQHHVLKCYEVYNYNGNYMRVCLEAVHHTDA